MNKAIQILECTLRDGSYTIDFQFRLAHTRQYAKRLDEAGLQKIEIGHGISLGASREGFGQAAEGDLDYIRAAREVVKNAMIGVFFIPGIGNRDDMVQAAEAGLDFIRIGTNVTESEKSHQYVQLAKSLGLEVSLNFMKSYAVTPQELFDRSKPIVDLGCDVLCLVDSAGCMLPKDIQRYIEVLRNHPARIGFHGHDNLNLAIANCLVAVESGATIVDTSIRGIGRGAGNAQTDILVELLERQGYQTGVDFFKVLELGEELEKDWNYTRGKSALDVIIGKASFHSSYLPLFRRIADEEKVNLFRLILDVSEIDVVRPSEELIRSCAQRLK